MKRPTLVALLLVAAGVGSTCGVLAARAHSRADARRQPAFHGLITWDAGQRAAPRFALRDQRGALVSLRSLRGRPVLLTFLDSRCKSLCPLEGRALASVLHRLPAAARPTLVIISVDRKGDTPPSVERAMHKWRLAGPWPWHWLNGTQTQLAAVWRDFGIEVEPTSNDIRHGMALYLIDRAGSERTGYLFPFVPGSLTSDLKHLAMGAA